MRSKILIPILIIIFLLLPSVIAVTYVNEYHDRTYLGNGQFNSIFYSSPMNYPVNNSADWGFDTINWLTYERINSTIVTSDKVGYNYEVEKGIYHAYFKEPANSSDLILLEHKHKVGNEYWTIYDNESIKITPILMQYYNGTDVEFISNIRDVNGTIFNNYINYSNAYTTENDVVDMQFRYLNDMLKEYLYIKNKNFNDTTLTGNVNLEFKNVIDINLDVFDVYADPDGDGVLTLQTGNFTNGHIEFRRKSDNKTKWKMPEPKAWDNESEIQSHYRVIRGNNQLEIYIQTNWTWINDSARNFPIVIDPTTSLSEAQALIKEDAFVIQNLGSTNFGSDNTIEVSSISSQNRRSFIEINFSDLNANSISNAFLYLYVNSIDATSSSINISMYMCNDTFDETTITWDNQDTEVTNCDSNPFFTDLMTNHDDINTWDLFNLTDEVQSELNDDYTFTIKIMADPEDYDSTTRKITWRSRDYTGTTYDPYLNITYTVSNMVGESNCVFATGYNSQRKLVRASDGTLYAGWRGSNDYYKGFISKSIDNGTTWSQIIDLGNSKTNPSIVIDGYDNLHIVYQDFSGTYNQIRYAEYNGTTLLGEILLSQPSTYDQVLPSLTLDDQYLYVIWQGKDSTYDSTYQIKFSQCDYVNTDCTQQGNWSSWINIQPISGYSQYHPTIATDGSYLYVTWYGRDASHPTIDSIKFTKCNLSTDCTIFSNWDSWIDAKYNGENQQSSSLAIRNGNPVITFMGYNTTLNGYGIYYNEYNGTNWGNNVKVYHINNPGGVSQNHPTISIDSSENIHILWHGTPNSSVLNAQIMYANSTDGSTFSNYYTFDFFDSSEIQAYANLRWQYYYMNGGVIDFIYTDTTDDLVFYGSISGTTAGQGAGVTCGISLNNTAPDFGSIEIGQESSEVIIRVTNTGSLSGNYTIEGTDWSGTTTLPVGRTAWGNTSGNFASKTALTTSAVTHKTNVAGGSFFDSYLQMKPENGDTAGTYSQNITYTVLC